MKILIVTHFFPPDITAAGFRLGDTATLLARLGHEVKVLAGEPHKGSAEGVNMGELVDPRVDVIRCYIKPLAKGGMRAYLGHYMSFVRSSIAGGWRLWRIGWRPDVIFCSSPPLFVGISGRFLARLFRKPLVFEVRDIWPDSAVAAGQLSQSGKGYRIGRSMEKHFYKKANHITCVAQPMAAYIRSQCNTPVTVVYNGIREQYVVPLTPNPTSANPARKRTILYAGNFGHVQNMELIVKGFIRAYHQGSVVNWNLRLIGNGTKLEQLNQIVVDNNAQDIVSIEPPVPREVIFEEMRNADALYLSLQKSYVLEHTIPSKVFDYMAMSRPIIAALAGEGREILESSGANICFEPGDESGLQIVLVRLVKEIEELQEKAPRNRDLVLERFTRERAVDNLICAFNNVIKR